MFSLLVVIVSLQVLVGADRLPEVEVEEGTVRGLVQKTIHGREYNAFLGIPFARPPVGKRRFRAPEPAESWIGVWNATTKPSYCLQYNYLTLHTPFEVMGSEDCLYVNVFTPKLPREAGFKPLDVLVYIHGGGFQFLTSSAYGPEYILDRDVVYVTFNYRLGALGFLSLEDDVLPGNNGLWDQNLALKWVKTNIAAFGGDPYRITLSGMSAGAASVHFHILSEHSKGLFQKAIMNSGAVSNPWAIAENIREQTVKIAASLGCPTGSSAKIVECLKERPAERIVKAIDILRPFNYLPESPIGPIIEAPSPSAFISKQPFDIIKSKKIPNDVPILWTFNSDEGQFPGGELIADQSGVLDENWDALMPHLLELNFTASPAKQLQIVHQLKEHYLGGKKIRQNPGGVTQLLGDRYFYNGIHDAAKLHAEFGSSNVYVYQFSYVGQQRLVNAYGIGDLYKGGACHGDDTHYVLRADYMPVEGNPDSEKMIKTLTDLWMDFIQGNMSPSWKPVKDSQSDLDLLDVVCTDPANNKMKSIPVTPGQALWKSFGLAENTVDLMKPSHKHNEL
ncbi:esterase [Nesidiocoris tenuis]|uniref:Carboxylic ester hydrolase n=1 Tax=Nesidiocoris tenuis TaxID=355587 RepID=A0ABN7B0P8_9HEMI|nr:esterase [Nesidiocoris tenuis]